LEWLLLAGGRVNSCISGIKRRQNYCGNANCLNLTVGFADAGCATAPYLMGKIQCAHYSLLLHAGQGIDYFGKLKIFAQVQSGKDANDAPNRPESSDAADGI
jgi:hypothetical protein